jgi:GT2 family glycosyltransferase
VKTAVVTAVRGRTTHLRKQLEGLGRNTFPPDRHVVVAIDDDDVEPVVRAGASSAAVIPLSSPTSRIPMAAARNLGAETAIGDGAELLIFLDVDCIPSRHLVDSYVRAAKEPAHDGSLLCGPVTYLPPSGPDGYDLDHLPALTDPHLARPAPPAGAVVATTDYHLFWSLSFAVTTAVWQRIGGFCTQYTGYGAEDTDFGQMACAASVPMRWVGGADAFHQYHPVSDPPVEHLLDIVLNARTFHERWGWWPMQGWLDAFEDRGLIRRHLDGTPSVLRDIGAETPPAR